MVVAVIYTGPDEHAYQLDLEFYGEVDEDDIKQVPCCLPAVSVLRLYSSIIPQPTPPFPQLATERFIMLVIAKKEPHEHWPRLLKAAGKPAPNIKASNCPNTAGCSTGVVLSSASIHDLVPSLQVDWDKWVDEDDEEEAGAAGGADMGGFDLSSLQNFGASGGMEDMLKGMGGAGGGFEDMSDDEEETGANRAGDDDDLPGLEPVPQQ